MNKLPFSPATCSSPATTRVEVYTPAADGSSSSLDACVYACDFHDAGVVAACWSADLNAYRVVMAPDVDRVCGEVYVFPTGNFGGEK